MLSQCCIGTFQCWFFYGVVVWSCQKPFPVTVDYDWSDWSTMRLQHIKHCWHNRIIDLRHHYSGWVLTVTLASRLITFQVSINFNFGRLNFIDNGFIENICQCFTSRAVWKLKIVFHFLSEVETVDGFVIFWIFRLSSQRTGLRIIVIKFIFIKRSRTFGVASYQLLWIILNFWILFLFLEDMVSLFCDELLKPGRFMQLIFFVNQIHGVDMSVFAGFADIPLGLFLLYGIFYWWKVWFFGDLSHFRS